MPGTEPPVEPPVERPGTDDRRGIDLDRDRKYDAAARRDAPRRTSGVQRVASGFLQRLRRLLHLDDTPHRAALAFAIGVFIGWSPALGFHILIALAVALALGLNRVAIVAGTFVNNPWTFVPIYTLSAWVGGHVTGSDAEIPRLQGGLSWGQVGAILEQCRPWIGPLMVGTLVMGIASALLAYVGALSLLRSYGALRRQE